MHGGSKSDDEVRRWRTSEDRNGGYIQEHLPRGREDERRVDQGGLSFGSWAHQPLESEIASDRN